MLIILLAVVLAGCSTTRTVTQVETVKISPPAILIAETSEPLLRGGTNGDLLNWALELLSSLRRCNADKAALREWASAEAEKAE